MAKKQKPVQIWEPEIIETHLQESGANMTANKPLVIRVRDALFKQYDFHHNEIRQVTEYREKKGEWQDFDDRAIRSFWIDFQENGDWHARDKPSRSLLENILYSKYVPLFNPIEHYFNTLKWDGENHIAKLAETVTVKPVAAQVVSEVQTTAKYWWPHLLERWLIAVVGCALGETKNDMMLLFIGDQGKGKTTWFQRLVPPELYKYYKEGYIEPTIGNSDTVNALAENFIVNIDDQLDTIFGKAFNSIKGVISADTRLKNRKAYRRDENIRKRRASFCGSINTERVFTDVENRRYLTFWAEEFTKDHEVNITQVWAQAAHLFKSAGNNKVAYMDEAEKLAVNTMNGHFSEISEEEQWLLKMFDYVKADDPFAKFYQPSEINSKLKAASGLNMSIYKLGRTLRKLGWVQVSKRRDGGSSMAIWVVPVYEKFIEGDRGDFKFNVQVER